MDEANALTSAREFDALKDEDVTPLPESKPHVVFRLRREEDEIAPWFVELVFLLFNAQGDVLQVVRGFKPPEAPTSSVRSTGNSGVVYFGEDNFRIARAKSKEAREREVVRFSMEKIHPFVEVVGCLVTYVEDEIARSPQLNAFSLTCDLHAVDSAQAEADAQALAAGGRRFVFDAGERVRLLEFVHDPKARRKLGSVQPNVLVLCKLYRRRGNYRDWACHAATDDRSSVVVRSAVTGTLVEAMQVFMLDIMPDIKIPNRKPLSSVAGICAALSRNDFSGIESHFPEKGLPKLDFARLLLFELMRTRPRLLQHVDRATVLVSILFEMFEQIDINGDGIVDWEEFTSFALGLIATRGRNDDNDQDQHGDGDSQDAPPRATITYRQDPLSTATASRSFPYQVNKLKTFVQLKRLAVIESKSSRILMFDMDMNFLHELNCGEKLAAEKKAGDKQQDVLETLEVLDAEHVPARNALAVASNDLCISVWSIIDATIGTYVFNGKLIGRFPALFVKWCPPPLKRLFVAGGSTDQVHLWDLEVPMHTGAAPPPPPMLLPRHHSERLAACLDIPESSYVATASFDHTITVWETVAGVNTSVGGPSAVLTVAFVLRGHQQAVLTLDYGHSLLLSSGFEYQAYCWGLPGRSLKTKLGGHHHCLMGAKFVSTSSSGPCLVVTGDQSGHFKLWDITRCAKGFSGSHLSVMLQTFELHTPNLCRFRMFTVASSGGGAGTDKQQEPHDEPGANSSLESPACDIITGNLRLYRFSAIPQALAAAQEDGSGDDTPGLSPTRNVIFNSVTNTFVGVVENRITVWNANSGAKIEVPVVVRDAEICAMVFDSPRERKLFVATNDGAVRQYNPVTGALLFKTVVHEGIVSSLVFCSHANVRYLLILKQLDANVDHKLLLHVPRAPAGKATLEVLHTVERAHKSSITCSACSPPPSSNDTQSTRFVATADDAGGVNMYDLQHLTLLFRCIGGHTREVRSLHFPNTTPRLLVSGDTVGDIFIWPTVNVRKSTTQPLLRLTLQSSLPSRPMQSKMDEGITSICSTTAPQDSNSANTSQMLYVSSENGQVFVWDLYHLAEKIRQEHPCARRSDVRRRCTFVPTAANNIDSIHDANSIVPRRLSNTLIEDENAADQEVPKTESSSALKSAESTKALPVVPSIRSWMAHTSGVQSTGNMPWPGELLSLGMDGIVKIWDCNSTCLGHIATAGEQTSTAASAWKFVRRDHAGGSDEKGLYERIAGEVIAKHRRKQKKEMKARNKHHSQRDQEALSRSAIGLSSVNSTLEMEMQPKKSPERQPAALSLFPDSSLAMTNAATALLTQLPFSATSVTTGIHQGIFRPEEAQHLRTLATKSSGLMADVADKRKRLATLAPLFQSAEEMGRIRAKAKAKARAAMNKGQDPAEISQAGTRFLTNYPLELERRAAANAAHATSSWHALDIEPSQFLLKKLPGAASPLRTPIKSTPKKRLIRSPVKLAQASMSPAKLQRNVSLPKLTAPASGHEPDESAHSSETLTSSASTPALRHTTPLLGERISSPNPDKLRSNVERKLKLCEKIVASVCLMTTHKSPKEPQARGSTPGSPGTKTRPTPSSISSMSSILAQGKNPFGPNYTVKQVEHLAVELARLDEDGSGDLDQREWMHLVQLCGLAGADAKDAVTSMDNLFHALDRDSSGAISIRELLPTLFTHATPDQLQQMRVLVQTRMKEIREKPIPQAAANSATTDATDNSTSE